MKTLISRALCFENGQLRVLDQRQLPHQEKWIVCQTIEDMVYAIQTLAVRGAPLIGVAASLSLAQFAETNPGKIAIDAAAQKLVLARPTAINLKFCIYQQLAQYYKTEDPQAIVVTAEQLFEEDKALSEAIANHGANIIQDNESILTHCNTGRLVTTGIGTALGAIFRAHEQGKKIHVYVNETRPLLQGARLTAWELVQAGIAHTLCCDNMAGTLMQQGKIQRIITGADCIAANGDTANKIGTYTLAALASLHHIPFHIAAPQTTIARHIVDGSDIPIEERADHEVRGFQDMQWAPAQTPVYNPAFDVTPHQWITSFILDSGISVPQDFTEFQKLVC